MSGGLATIPFDWDLVDAYWLMERFAPLRTERGDSAEPAQAAGAGDRLARALEHGTGVQTLILHPFLMLDEAWSEQAQRLLEQLARLADDGRSWVVPGGVLAHALGAARPQ